RELFPSGQRRRTVPDGRLSHALDRERSQIMLQQRLVQHPHILIKTTQLHAKSTVSRWDFQILPQHNQPRQRINNSQYRKRHRRLVPSNSQHERTFPRDPGQPCQLPDHIVSLPIPESLLALHRHPPRPNCRGRHRIREETQDEVSWTGGKVNLPKLSLRRLGETAFLITFLLIWLPRTIP